MTTPSISEDGAKQLIDQLVLMGYFHDSSSSTRAHPQSDDDYLETFRKLQKDPPRSFSADLKCQIIPSLDGKQYYTQGGLVKALVRELEKMGGRHPMESLARKLNVDSRYMQGHLLTTLPSAVQVMGLDLISDSFWNNLRNEIKIQVEHQGKVSVLDLASQYIVPMESLLVQCLEKLENTKLIEGGKTLVSAAHLGKLKSNVISTFQQLNEPTQLSTICQDHRWDRALVLDWLSTHDMAGQLHVDPSNTSMAMFVPKAYTERQNLAILDFLSVNGYMTVDRAVAQGVSMGQVTTLVKQHYSDVIDIKGVLVLEFIVQNVQVAIQEISSHAILDVQEYLPAELTERDILRDLLQRAGFTEDHGLALVSDGQAILVSREFIREVSQSVLPPLIETYSKTKAEQIHNSQKAAAEDDEEGADVAPRKGRSRARKHKAGRSNKQPSDLVSAGVVPLLQVAGAILSGYPKLASETTEQDLLDQADRINWDDEEHSEMLVVEFCKRALFTDSFRSSCDKAVKAELRRLKSVTESKSTLSRKDNAAKVRSVESSFEEAFVTSCYLIQASTKFITLASASDCFDDSSLETLKRELLQGCCADLTSRITQFCLFKNEEETLFTFRSAGEQSIKDPGASGLPEWCRLVDTVVHEPSYRSYLSCPPPREPLPVLRESLAGSTGVTLARQWILCGGECYRGGIRVSETDGSTYVRPGNLEGFLSHAEENCLTVCGIPFKKMDKKSEKQFLFGRRQAMTEILQNASDPDQILDLAIMILFQQVKQAVVCGSLLRGPILDMLVEERKISPPVASALKGLNTQIKEGGTINYDLVTAIKNCGLCRDIGKHDMPDIVGIVKE